MEAHNLLKYKSNTIIRIIPKSNHLLMTYFHAMPYFFGIGASNLILSASLVFSESIRQLCYKHAWLAGLNIGFLVYSLSSVLQINLIVDHGKILNDHVIDLWNPLE